MVRPKLLKPRKPPQVSPAGSDPPFLGFTALFPQKCKKNLTVICSNMDGPRDCLTESEKEKHKSEKEKHWMRSLMCGSKKKVIQMNLLTKQERDSQT